MRHRVLSLALTWIAACVSQRDQKSIPEQSPRTSEAATTVARARVPCQPPEPCGDWLIHTTAFEHGDEPARFAGSFRQVGDRIFLWLDTAVAYTIWVGVDSINATLRPKERLAQACGLRGRELDGGIVAIVQDTAADQYPAPRLAWRLDLDTRRIRPLLPDSVYCEREYVGE